MARIHDYCSIEDSLPQFLSDAIDLCSADILLNTVFLSECKALNEMQAAAAGRVLALCSCEECSSACAVLAPGSTASAAAAGLFGMSKLYVSTGVCSHSAQLIVQRLAGLQWGMLTAPAASASALERAGLPATMLQRMNVMVQQHQPPAATDHASQLRALSRDRPEDVQFIYEWSAEFIQEATHSSSRPSDDEISSVVTPWLSHGDYFVLENGTAPEAAALEADAAAAPGGERLCLLCHVPTSAASCRIVLVFTPSAKRKHGHARVAVRQLCDLLQQQGFSHICLMASQANPTANRVYQDVGFVTAGEMFLGTNTGSTNTGQHASSTGVTPRPGHSV